jgi:hypothetical protein
VRSHRWNRIRIDNTRDNGTIAMKRGRPRLTLLATALLIALFFATTAFAQSPSSPIATQTLSISSANVAASSARQIEASIMPSARASAAPAWSGSGEHPLTPVLRWAKQEMPTLENLKDYSATLVRRERVHGSLTGYEYVFVKIRHTPFSVYVLFQSPAGVKGQEVVYVAGKNEGNMLAHKPRMSVALSVPPAGMIAMTGRNYPLTEIGVVNLVRRLVEVGEHDLKYGECEVKYYTTAKVDNRPCTVIQVVHPVARDTFTFHLARIFVDDELKVPTRYESYDWPREPGGDPRLIEEYTYLNLKLNNGFTDEDFSTANPEYRFQ